MKWLFLLVVLLNAAFLSWHNLAKDSAVQNKENIYGPPVSEKIHLLSEDAAVSEQDYNAGVVSNDELVEALNRVVEKQSATPQENLLCPRIVADNQSSRASVKAELQKVGWAFDEKEVTGKRPKFWLYISAPETQQQAAAIVKDLASKKIDSFVITRAEMKNRISLGLYSAQDRAEQAKQRIEKSSGYPVDIYEHLRTVPLFELDIKDPVKVVDWDAFVVRFDLSKMMIKIEKNPC
ncbi:SPOR domain-containing protein [Marinomonas sp. THO17]|uniref:SPOR domain-containing protein n=1 Tax=Marinomonas sp. THO17 TaxID=3149048 RepID=UPI00336BDC75